MTQEEKVEGWKVLLESFPKDANGHYDINATAVQLRDYASGGTMGLIDTRKLAIELGMDKRRVVTFREDNLDGLLQFILDSLANGAVLLNTSPSQPPANIQVEERLALAQRARELNNAAPTANRRPQAWFTDASMEQLQAFIQEIQGLPAPAPGNGVPAPAPAANGWTSVTGYTVPQNCIDRDPEVARAILEASTKTRAQLSKYPTKGHPTGLRIWINRNFLKLSPEEMKKASIIECLLQHFHPEGHPEYYPEGINPNAPPAPVAAAHAPAPTPVVPTPVVPSPIPALDLTEPARETVLPGDGAPSVPAPPPVPNFSDMSDADRLTRMEAELALCHATIRQMFGLLKDMDLVLGKLGGMVTALPPHVRTCAQVIAHEGWRPPATAP